MEKKTSQEKAAHGEPADLQEGSRTRGEIPDHGTTAHYPAGPVYYMGHPPMAAGPAYGPYGAAYGPYGSPYGTPYGEDAGPDGDSLIGPVTIKRILRVCLHRWITIAVVTVLGAVGAFVIYRALPAIYEGTSVLEVNVRRPRIAKTESAVIEESGGTSAEDAFGTRLSKLHGRSMLRATLRRFRADNPSSTVSDAELFVTLRDRTTVQQQRRTQLVMISVRSTNATLAVTLANAYAAAADAKVQEENRGQGEKAVEWLKGTLESQKRDLARRDQEILDFRNANQIDTMEGERKKAEATQLTLNADAVALETQITRARELEKTLSGLQNDPDKFGALPESAPRAEGLVTSYQRLQTVMTERNVLLTRFTANHPEVAAREKQVEQLRQQFVEEVTRAHETAKANLGLLQQQMTDNTRRREEVDRKASELEQRIVTAKTRLETQQREKEVAELNFRTLLAREREASLSVDENTAAIRVVEEAEVSEQPVSPNPFLVLPAGPLAGLLLGILFVLLLDQLDDRIIGIASIEHLIGLKVLAVLPRIRRAKRGEVALLAAEDRSSHFAEAFAGLRTLLDSPRYAKRSKVILIVSTQPSEGKTITASNLALASAMCGQRTLLIDFDLRRPRVADIYGQKGREFESLFHTLTTGDLSQFSRLPVPSGHANLDLVCTRPSEVSPANLLGSGTVVRFIEWARQNYERVVIDSPPFGLVSDSVALSTLTDGIIVICCPERTRFRPLKHAVTHLSEAGGHVVGVVVNDVDFGHAGMFGGYERQYHMSYPYNSAKDYVYEHGADDRAPQGGDGEKTPPANRAGETKVILPAPARMDDDDE